MEHKKFRRGDKVRWKSQSGGTTLEKDGEVEFIIPINKHPKIFCLELWECHRYHMMFKDEGFSRDHESYLVCVHPVKGKALPKLYWPHVSLLEHNK